MWQRHSITTIKPPPTKKYTPTRNPPARKNKYIEPPMHTQNAPPNQQCTHMMQTQIIQLVGIHQITKCSTNNYNLQPVLIMQISHTINPNPTTQTPSPRMVKRIARRNKESEKGIFCMGLCIGFFFEVMPWRHCRSNGIMTLPKGCHYCITEVMLFRHYRSSTIMGSSQILLLLAFLNIGIKIIAGCPRVI